MDGRTWGGEEEGDEERAKGGKGGNSRISQWEVWKRMEEVQKDSWSFRKRGMDERLEG